MFSVRAFTQFFLEDSFSIIRMPLKKMKIWIGRHGGGVRGQRRYKKRFSGAMLPAPFFMTIQSVIRIIGNVRNQMLAAIGGPQMSAAMVLSPIFQNVTDAITRIRRNRPMTDF